MTTPRREMLAEGVTFWRPAINGSGCRPWFVLRDAVGDERSTGMPSVYHERVDGSLVRFGSRRAAERRACELNGMGLRS